MRKPSGIGTPTWIRSFVKVGHGEGRILGVLGVLLDYELTQARQIGLILRASDFGDPVERFTDVADDSGGKDVVLVNLGGRLIDVDDLRMLLGVPQIRVVLHHIIAHANDHVGAIEPAVHIVVDEHSEAASRLARIGPAESL